MKILLITTFFPPIEVGGAEKSVGELASELVELGHEVGVATLAPPWASGEPADAAVRMYRRRSKAAVPYFRPKAGVTSLLHKLVWHLAETFRLSNYMFLKRAIKDFDPDVIHTNAVGGFGAISWLIAPAVPRVHTLRDFYVVCTSFRTFKLGSNCERQCTSCSLLRFGVERAALRSAEVVSISRATAERHQQFGAFRGREIAVIPNTPTQYVTVRRAGADHCTVGFIGRVEEYKGIWVALEGFEQVDDPTMRFLVAGSGDPDDIRRVSEYGDSRVEYLGRVAATDFYSKVDVVLVPSQWHESFGRVAAEAYLSGCAVIVSGVGGLPEAIGIAPAARALVVEDWSAPSAWARAINSFREFRSTGASAGEFRAPSRSTGSLYEDVYQRAVDSGRGNQS